MNLVLWSEEEDRRVNKEKVVDFAEGDEFYHDLESYGWDWFKALDLPEAPQRRYYSKMKVKQADGNGFLVEDLDIPTSRGVKTVKWRPSDFLRLANKDIPENGIRITKRLIQEHGIMRR